MPTKQHTDHFECPSCGCHIPAKAIARHLAAVGGRKSRRAITPEQQAAMQAALKAARETRKQAQPTT